MKPILIVEDEQALAAALAAVCRRLGHEARTVFSGVRGLEEIAATEWALAIVDIGLPDMNGLDLLGKVRERLPVIIITAHGNLDNAVAAKKLGAAAYLVKPLELAEVEETLRQVLVTVPDPSAPSAPPQLLVGAAPAMQRSFVEIAHACTSDAPVLLTGPTGTGKTHTARIIHAQSARREGPFIALHCSALPEQLLEAELFGYEKGAFTGAGTVRSGHLERAHGGTLFLDEIADISPAIQAKLLRFVEERTFTRVGGREDLRVDLRLITATHRELRHEVRAGRFREDLYYRLHVLEIQLPALRDRPGDLPALAAFFLGSLAPARRVVLAAETMNALLAHDWPGNVRELRNVLEHGVAVSSGTVLLLQHLPRMFQTARIPAPGALEPALAAWLQQRLAAGATYREMHDELEALALRHLLTHFGGRPTVLARETKMNRVTLRKKALRLADQPSTEDRARV